jgi:hypothetical protein
MYRTVTDGKDGYVYGEWTDKETALKQAGSMQSQGLTWVEDEQSNRVS